ncbi:hypothetical protein JOQ06_021025, partial [Pogonophryne albipinna]
MLMPILMMDFKEKCKREVQEQKLEKRNASKMGRHFREYKSAQLFLVPDRIGG